MRTLLSGRYLSARSQPPGYTGLLLEDRSLHLLGRYVPPVEKSLHREERTALFTMTSLDSRKIMNEAK